MKTQAHYQSLEFKRVNALLARRACDSAKRLRILDFGFGRGKYFDSFAALRAEVVGVDSNPAYVAEAESKGVRAHSPEAFFGTDGTGFDVIFLSHVVEHLTPEALVDLVPRLCARLAPGGWLMIVTPTPGERFYHDFSHVRPYLPQSIRHAFGQVGAPISFGESRLIELVDIHFFRDPFRPRTWRSFYFGSRPARMLVSVLNAISETAWRLSGGRIGVVASWLGIYVLVPGDR
jgi:hypothetical protein